MNQATVYQPLFLVETADLLREKWLEYRRLGIGGSRSKSKSKEKKPTAKKESEKKPPAPEPTADDQLTLGDFCLLEKAG